jgi:hypothetical protein
MQESWSFEFSPTQNPNEELKSLLIAKEKELGIFLSYYYKSEGAVAEKVRIKAGPEFQSKNAGWLILDFDLVYFNACLAINEQERAEMKLTFEWDEKEQKLHLLGAYWPKREMDEI